ncbi:MAG: ParB N-terminal domain-containing protein [Candidatus Bilamarchaeaceae archaeon]
MKLEKRLVKDLKYYPGNPRTMSEKMLEKLKKSIQEFGLVDPLIINTKNEVIGGNQRLHILKELGIQEVDVVVVDLSKNKEKALNLALNKISGEFDEDLLRSFVDDLEFTELELAGFSPLELEKLEVEIDDEIEANPYTFKITPIHYEPKGKPALGELYDDTKYKQLLTEIDKAKIPEDVKEFLRLSAIRFVRFNFSKIADFYANTDKETQELFEKLALVIVDFNDAIYNGFVKFTEKVNRLLKEYEQ